MIIENDRLSPPYSAGRMDYTARSFRVTSFMVCFAATLLCWKMVGVALQNHIKKTHAPGAIIGFGAAIQFIFERPLKRYELVIKIFNRSQNFFKQDCVDPVGAKLQNLPAGWPTF